MSHPMVFVTTFLAACVEVLEPLIIVVGLAAIAGDARGGLVPAPAWPSWRYSSWG